MTLNPDDAEVASRWPPEPPLGGGSHSHAWFAGFLQPVDERHEPDWSSPARIAFAVLVEFGGSGGRTGGPLAQAVAAEILDVLGDDLLIAPVVAAPVAP